MERNISQPHGVQSSAVTIVTIMNKNLVGGALHDDLWTSLLIAFQIAIASSMFVIMYYAHADTILMLKCKD